MPRTKKGTVALQIQIPDDAHKALVELTEIEGMKSISDLIRRLLTNYCQINGHDIDFGNGEWGGARRKREQTKD